MKVVLPVALTWLAFAWYLGPALDHELASAGSPPVVKHTSSADVVQGKSAVWWARRAIQNGKNSRARGRTIRHLQSVARGQLTYPTGHWLDGAFLCIHSHEARRAGWAANTGNGYRGGLQMDWSFSDTYAPDWVLKQFGRSPALWPASVQIAVGIHAWITRGFGPWPNTSRMCGLR